MEKKIRNLIFLEDVFPPPVLKSNTQERELFTSYQENGSPENPFDPFSKSDLKWFLSCVYDLRTSGGKHLARIIFLSSLIYSFDLWKHVLVFMWERSKKNFLENLFWHVWNWVKCIVSRETLFFVRHIFCVFFNTRPLEKKKRSLFLILSILKTQKIGAIFFFLPCVKLCDFFSAKCVFTNGKQT